MVWNIFYIGNNNPSWRSHIFQRGRVGQPPTLTEQSSQGAWFSCPSGGRWQEAFCLLQSMRDAKVPPNSVTCCDQQKANGFETRFFLPQDGEGESNRWVRKQRPESDIHIYILYTHIIIHIYILYTYYMYMAGSDTGIHGCTVQPRRINRQTCKEVSRCRVTLFVNVCWNHISTWLTYKHLQTPSWNLWPDGRVFIYLRYVKCM